MNWGLVVFAVSAGYLLISWSVRLIALCDDVAAIRKVLEVKNDAE